MKELIRKWKLPVLMLGPFLILVFLFFFLPVILTAIMAFTGMNSAMRWEFIGWENFRRLFSDPNLGLILKNTAVYIGFTLLINVFFGLALALMTAYFIKNETAGLFFRTIWMLPRISPPVVYSLLWIWFFDPSDYGLLNGIRSFFGLDPVNLIGNHPMAIIILANGFIGASFGMIIFSSAIQSIPKERFYAASVDGAGHGSVIRDIILPAIRWPFMFITIWQLLSLLTSYEYILLITNGGPLNRSEVLALYSYHEAFQNFQFGYGSAVSLIIVVIALVLTLILWRFFRMKELMGTSKIE
jgi:carbohydrate ABC transporter membrane protein 1, CUT1 family (TC 3.A.1.1.-)